MTDEEREKFRKAMLKPDSRAKARVDSELLEFRPMYARLDAREKDNLKQWIQEVLGVERKQPRFLDMKLRLTFSKQVGEDEYRTVRLPLPAILKAMETWDKGELYTPKTLGELYG